MDICYGCGRPLTDYEVVYCKSCGHLMVPSDVDLDSVNLDDWDDDL